jgi:hypothetical protein
MGAAVSALPDELDTETIIRLAGSNDFKQELFDTVKSPDGTVSRALFIKCVETGPEKEVFQLFLHYAHSTRMSNTEFRDFCRSLKLLNKKVNVFVADGIFNRALSNGSDTIRYYEFRTKIIPEFARLRDMDEDDIIELLSRRDLPVSKPPIENSNPFEVVIDTNVSKVDEGTSSTHSTPKQNEAATKLQTLSRQKMAKRQVAYMKEVQDIKSGRRQSRRHSEQDSVESENIKRLIAQHDALKKELQVLMDGAPGAEIPEVLSKQESVVEIVQRDLSDEERIDLMLHDLFDAYCSPPNEMDTNMFKKFLRETYTFTKKFTILDADAIFKKVIAKALSAPKTSQLGQGVFFDKRINFYVFRTEAIPKIASARGGMSVSQLITFLNNANVAVRNRDAKKLNARKSFDSKEMASSRASKKHSGELASLTG